MRCQMKESRDGMGRPVLFLDNRIGLIGVDEGRTDGHAYRGDYRQPGHVG